MTRGGLCPRIPRKPHAQRGLGFLNRAALNLCAIIVLLPAALRAEPQTPTDRPPAAVGDVSPADRPIYEGHGWIARRDDQRSITDILHLAPRDGAERILGSWTFAPGVSGTVERIAWWRNRLYLVLPPVRTTNATTERVLHYRGVEETLVVRSAIGTWVYPEESPRVLAELPGEPDLIGFSAGDEGVFALFKPLRRGQTVAAPSVPGAPGAISERDGSLDPDDLNESELDILVNGQWQICPLPWQINRSIPGDAAPPEIQQAARTQVRMWADRDGVNVLTYTRGASAAEWWSGVPSRDHSSQMGPPPPLAWKRTDYPLTPSNNTDAAALPRPSRLGQVYFVPGPTRADDQVISVCWRARQNVVVLKSLRPSGPVVLSRMEGVPPDAWVVPMSACFNSSTGVTSSGRVVLAWYEPKAKAPNSGGAVSRPASESAPPNFHIREISAQTGRTLYDGPFRSEGWISPQRYQTLAVVLVLMTACVLAFVLRGGNGTSVDQAAVVLPEDVVPADPVRRLVAAVLDYAAAGIAASLILQVPATSAFNPGVFVIVDADLGPTLLAFGLTILHCSLGEWVFGRSLGKVVTGCTVAWLKISSPGVPAELARPRLWQALTRNVVRWTLPLLALFVLMDPMGRHPGDLAARTIVLMRRPDDQEDNPDG